MRVMLVWYFQPFVPGGGSKIWQVFFVWLDLSRDLSRAFVNPRAPQKLHFMIRRLDVCRFVFIENKESIV